MITGVDHVVILVAGLQEAIGNYVALGFTVEPGGEHPRWGTENALIPLADGSYLELLATRDRSRAAGHRLWQRSDGAIRAPGEYAGFMVGSDDLDRDVARLRSHGLTVEDPSPGARVRPDGQEVRWRLAFPERRDLPALIQDETPRSVRVPAPRDGLNAYARMAAVNVVTRDGRDAVLALARMLGAHHNADQHAGDARFDLTVGRIAVVVAPPGSAGFDHLRRSGPGVFSITLTLDAHSSRSPQRTTAVETRPGLLDPLKTGGVRIFLEERPRER